MAASVLGGGEAIVGIGGVGPVAMHLHMNFERRRLHGDLNDPTTIRTDRAILGIQSVQQLGDRKSVV